MNILAFYDVPWYCWPLTASLVGVVGAITVAVLAYQGQRHLKTIDAVVDIRRHLDIVIICLECLANKQHKNGPNYLQQLHKNNMEYTAAWRSTAYLFPQYVYRRFNEIGFHIDCAVDLIEEGKPYADQLKTIHGLVNELDGWLNHISDKHPSVPSIRKSSPL